MHQPPPILSLIAAMAEGRVIGRENRLPWHLPADLQHFKQLTLGKPMIMGRKTWESLPGLLPGRQHILVSRDPHYQAQGALVAHSLEQALDLAGPVEEVMVIGGAELYRQALPLAQRLYLTQIRLQAAGDALFPAIDPDQWLLVERNQHQADARNPHDYCFLRFERR